MREDISDLRKLAAKADKIWQSSSARSVNAESATSLAPMMILSMLFANVLNLALIPVLLHVLHNLCPPVQPSISAGIIANKLIRLNIAELRAHGIRETN